MKQRSLKKEKERDLQESCSSQFFAALAMIAMRIIKTISPVAAKHTFFRLALFWKTQNQKKITMATKKKEWIQMVYDLFTHLPHFVIC